MPQDFLSGLGLKPETTDYNTPLQSELSKALMMALQSKQMDYNPNIAGGWTSSMVNALRDVNSGFYRNQALRANQNVTQDAAQKQGDILFGSGQPSPNIGGGVTTGAINRPYNPAGDPNKLDITGGNSPEQPLPADPLVRDNPIAPKPIAPASNLGIPEFETTVKNPWGGLSIANGVDEKAPYMSRPRDVKNTKGIIIHGDKEENPDNLARYGTRVDPARGYDPNYHYIIGRDGRIVNAVPDDRVAHHAGNLNKNNIGIVLAGVVDGKKPTPEQYEAASQLSQSLAEKYGFGQGSIRSHPEVAGHKSKLEGGDFAKLTREYGFDRSKWPGAAQKKLDQTVAEEILKPEVVAPLSRSSIEANRGINLAKTKAPEPALIREGFGRAINAPPELNFPETQRQPITAANARGMEIPPDASVYNFTNGKINPNAPLAGKLNDFDDPTFKKTVSDVVNGVSKVAGPNIKYGPEDRESKNTNTLQTLVPSPDPVNRFSGRMNLGGPKEDQAYLPQSAEPAKDAEHMISIPGYTGPAPKVVGLPSEAEVRALLSSPMIASDPDAVANIVEQYREKAKPYRVPVPGGELEITPKPRGQVADYKFHPTNKVESLSVGGMTIPMNTIMSPDGKKGYQLQIPGFENKVFSSQGEAGTAVEKLLRGAQGMAQEGQAGLDLTKNATDLVNTAVQQGTASNDIIKTLRTMDALSKSADWNMPRGPTNEFMVSMRQFLSNVTGSPISDSTSSAEVIQKLNNFLASTSTKAITDRGTNFDLQTFMRANPSLTQTKQGMESLIDIMTQEYSAKQKIGQMANSLSPAEVRKFPEMVAKYQNENPVKFNFGNKRVNGYPVKEESDLKYIQSGEWFLTPAGTLARKP